MTTVTWTRLDPPGECTNPDGHELMDVVVSECEVPLYTMCVRCQHRGEIGTVHQLPLPFEQPDGQDAA